MGRAPHAGLIGVLVLAGAPLAATEPVARVGSRIVDGATLEQAVQRALNARYFHAGVGEESKLLLRKEELSRLLRENLDVLGGLDRGLPLPVEEARRLRARMEKELGREEYERSIGAHGWDRAAHEKVLAETLLGREANRRFVLLPSTVTEDDVKELYVTRADKLLVPETRRLFHILLSVPPGSPEPAWVAREEEAKALRKRLDAGEPFSLLAERSSDAPHRVKGGDLGWVHRGRLEEPVESAAWSFPVGVTVGPLRGEDGFHILFIAECRDPRILSFEEAAPKLRRELSEDRRRAAEERWYREVRSKHPIEILDPALKGTEP